MIKFFLYLLPLTVPFYSIASGLQDILQPDSLIFDVGAHLGNKTAYYLSLKASKVICFEPNPSVFGLLQDRYQKDVRVLVEPIGLSCEEGVTIFYPAVCSTLSTMASDWKTGRFKEYSWNAGIQVPVSTLDIMIQKHGIPDYCKIDVEGYEYSILIGLNQHIPCLSFEFAFEFLDQKTQPCLDRLVQVGFTEFNVAFGENLEFVFDEWVNAEYIYNYLCNNPDVLSWGDIYAR